MTVTVSESGGYIFDGGTLSAVSDGSGVASFGDLVINATGTYTLEFSSTGLTPISSNTFDVTAGPASSYSFATIGSPQQAGVAFGITITALDSQGNTADSYAGTANLSTTAGTISPATAGFTGGVASLSVDVSEAGSAQSITATDQGDGSITGTSNTFDVDPGAISATGSSVTATSPHTADGTDASTVTIVLQDDNGNAITGLSSVDFTVGLSGSANTDGNVTETGTPGTYTVAVTNTVLESVTVTITVDTVTLDDMPSITFQ